MELQRFPIVPFEVYPAIDLRQGRVVRLRTGDPDQQTTYALTPEQAARRWCEQGARWLHVVNLDGAFGEPASASQQAVRQIAATTAGYGAKVQFGGGVRSLAVVEAVLNAGVARVVLGTVLIEQPELLPLALARWGIERIAAGVDACQGMVKVRGWGTDGGVSALKLAQKLTAQGLRWMIYTDIGRDGTGQGADLAGTVELSRQSGLQVIASGGFNRLEEVAAARSAGLAGVILGRSLYEGRIQLDEALAFTDGGKNVGKTNHSLS